MAKKKTKSKTKKKLVKTSTKKKVTTKSLTKKKKKVIKKTKSSINNKKNSPKKTDQPKLETSEHVIKKKIDIENNLSNVDTPAIKENLKLQGYRFLILDNLLIFFT